MASITLKLDTRRANAGGRYPVQLQLSHNSMSTTISTGISIRAEHWIGEVNKAVATQCPNSKAFNSDIEALYFKYSNILRQMEIDGALVGVSVTDIRKTITKTKQECKVCGFIEYYKGIMLRKNRGTALIYRQTLTKLQQFAKASSESWLLPDITIDWLGRFEYFLRRQHLNEKGQPIDGVREITANGIFLHLKNIRSVINSALDDELIVKYPFRKYKLHQEETAKRSLMIDELRTLRDYPCEPHQEKYRDLFMLIFYLVGINTIDLFELKEVHNGRIEYRRSKTGRLFSIKVEPEAQAIIDKYRGKGYLLDVLDTYHNYKDFAHRMNYNLQQIGEVKIVKDRVNKLRKKERSPVFSKLTTYWARHTWATVAAELDIPDETISLALGHSSGNRVTNIYINRNLKKVDEANRKVIDYLFGVIREEVDKK